MPARSSANVLVSDVGRKHHLSGKDRDRPLPGNPVGYVGVNEFMYHFLHLLPPFVLVSAATTADDDGFRRFDFQHFRLVHSHGKLHHRLNLVYYV